jgi:hypothetical protein
MRRLIFSLLLLILLVNVVPGMAQAGDQAVDFIPADVAGIIRLNLSNPNETLQGLNAALFTASQVQRGRLSYEGAPPAFEALLPLRDWFRTDAPGATLDEAVIPWADGEIVVAYRQFDSQLRATPEDMLLVIPSQSLIEAAAGLSAFIGGEPAAEARDYRGVPLYVRRGIAIANTTPVVLIGPEALVQQALDVQAGLTESLGASATWQAVAQAADPEAFLFAYAQGEAVLTAVSGVISGQARSQDLYGLLGDLLQQTRGGDAFETRLLDGGFDAVGVSLRAAFAATGGRLDGQAIFHTPGGTVLADESAPLNPDLLNYIPRNALLVGQGADLSDLLEDATALLPLTNFANQLIGGLPIQTLGTESELVEVPSVVSALDAQSVLLDLLRSAGGLDLGADVTQPLSGPYALALLPRPNDPLPIINSPADVLLVAQPADAEAALEGLGRLLPLIFGVQPLEPAEGDDSGFQRFGRGGAVIFSLGVVDERLILTTGFEAPTLALTAADGENRLLSLEPWQALLEDFPAAWLVDTSLLYNTFFPQAGAQVPALESRTRLALRYEQRPDGLQVVIWKAAFPVG